MDKLKDMWTGLDFINQVIFVTGVIALIWSLIMGGGLSGVLLMVLMLAMIVSRRNNMIKRRGRMYGTMYFLMPDGEMVPRTFEQVHSEYTHGGQGRYNGRRVTVCFPWWRVTSTGDGDTGFGLGIRLRNNEELAREAATFKRGEFIRVTGEINAVAKDYFVIDEVEELVRITEDELYPLKDQFN